MYASAYEEWFFSNVWNLMERASAFGFTVEYFLKASSTECSELTSNRKIRFVLGISISK